MQYDLLLSLPPNMCRHLEGCEPRVAERAFATFDPPDRQLGSGGGTAYVLEQAWRASDTEDFSEWLNRSGKLIVHGGGESRRLPSYAAAGKLFMPMPVLRWALGQRLDQTLLDWSEPMLQRLARAASNHARVMVVSGDALIRMDGEIPRIPPADVVFFGIWVKPEEAQQFGVMFCEPHAPEKLITFLQKPSADTIREKSRHHAFLIDVGIWLLSEKAVNCLMKKSGWNEARQRFLNATPDSCDLYGQWALCLGESPVEHDPEISPLTTAVVPLAEAGFYHFGTSSDLIQSSYSLQNLVSDQTKLGAVATFAQPRQFIQNATFDVPLRREENHSLWVENSCIPASWKIASENILTNVPENSWELELEDGVCLDFVPVDEKTALRVYGYRDRFRGAAGDPATEWIHRPFAAWLDKRGMHAADAGIDAETDLQQAPIFPLMDTCDPAFIKWMFAAEPEASEKWRTVWLSAMRLSARELAQRANLSRLYAVRQANRLKALPLMAAHAEQSVFYKLDLEAVAGLYAESPHELTPQADVATFRNPLIALHDRMFRAAVKRHRGNGDWKEHEHEAFQVLRDLIVDRYKQQPVMPSCTLYDDQIVWGRCPVRLDFAGGWTDTPPYSLEHGGTVLNIAVELNGQPPIQVFARSTPQHELVIHSIDLGQTERLRSYSDVRAYDQLDSAFTLARAVFAISGFHPDFNGGRYTSLEDQLKAMGGGIEISMLAAIPKGSGLGTSSILAATILGVLSEIAGYRWDHVQIVQRTLAVEQMLTSGGGWQDQVGGVFPGIKLIQTAPGLEQQPIIRWLPGRFFEEPVKNRMLLYYTGITRIACDILGEIVRGIFLNADARLEVVNTIGRTALFCHDAIQREDFEAFAESIRRSWNLNRQLDSGTNPEEVQTILNTAGEDLAAAKLLGAGGGGFLFMIAQDERAALSIRKRLEESPPNEGARFVDFALSNSGLQVTRS